jgi:hypothetical protein
MFYSDLRYLAEPMAAGCIDGCDVGSTLGSDGKMIKSSMRVTAAFLASKRPFTIDPAAVEIEAKAMMLPMTDTPAMMVAEDPTCQVTWLALPRPFLKITWLVEAKRSAEPTWKVL